MIILGLGSNIGDKLSYLRRALQHIRVIPGVTVIRVAPLYVSEALLPDHAPDHWNMAYINTAIAIETSLAPAELLGQLKRIEIHLGRNQNKERWSPRMIDIDILAWDELQITSDHLTIPQKELFNRPFALWPLADIAPFFIWQGKTAAEHVEKWGSRFSKNAPLQTHQIYHRIDTPELIGTINVTPDSFSDGGKYLNTEYAIAQAKQLILDGASILDFGAESTSPTAEPIDSQTEWARLEPILHEIYLIKKSFSLMPKISVDTRHADVAEKALHYGVDWINDVSGLDDLRMQDIIVQSQCDFVVMHHLNIPERRNCVLPRHEDVIRLVYEWGENRLNELEKRGIARHRIIFDPGVGFGKMAEQSFAVIREIEHFSKLGVRLLVGHSRKSYLSLLTEKKYSERDIETTALSIYLSRKPVDYLRLHQIEMCSRAFKASATVWNDPNITTQSSGLTSCANDCSAASTEDSTVTA
ncbi:MAG: hypothetical protein A3F43_03465 [Gammaproteobacteria bacterium RIFCSPHIGHO2_12_FULL_42_10]|nr:MAG: hypothetical protein A3F43_03465 [Gammaproteobacteria bacterium RIFCSPHIGHO2_12_FULL_42_10]